MNQKPAHLDKRLHPFILLLFFFSRRGRGKRKGIPVNRSSFRSFGKIRASSSSWVVPPG